MASITVTITDSTKGPFSLADLFLGAAAPTGVTVLPAAPQAPSKRPAYVSIQSDAANAALKVYVGDKNILADGSVQGVKLVAGNTAVVPQMTPLWELGGRYVNGDNGAVVNIEVLGGN